MITAVLINTTAESKILKFNTDSEEEALELHYIAKTGTPSITYLNESSHKFVSALREIRERNFYFTLDAGPNVHLISEQDISQEVERILQKLGLQCEIWKDEQGYGPEFF
jgi:diphosphomevalonate decarboxylase